MRTNRHGRKDRVRKLLGILMAAVLALGAAACASAEDDRFDREPDVILARDAARRLDLQEPDGSPLNVRLDPELPGRGEAKGDGTMPDYTGVIGFASLPNDPEISKFSVFDKAYWMVPVYRMTEDGYTAGGTIAHKTPVVVTGQEPAPDGEGRYTGWLEAVRLDTGAMCILEAQCFVTVPYWTLPVREASKYGYSIAVYRETIGTGPKDESGHSRMLRDGTRVLIPFEGACPDTNPDPDTLQIQGIIFSENEKGEILPVTVYFRESDLVPNY